MSLPSNEKSGISAVCFSQRFGKRLFDFLPEDLQDSKFRQVDRLGMDVILPEKLSHDIEQFLVVIGILHIDKIDQDHSGKIPERNLTGRFGRCFQIDLPVSLFRTSALQAFSGIHVDGNKCLGLFDDKKASAFQPDFFLRQPVQIMRFSSS